MTKDAVILAVEKIARAELKMPNDHKFTQCELMELKPLLQRIVNEHPELGYKMEKIAPGRYLMMPIN
jgi:hypothetical protein